MFPGGTEGRRAIGVEFAKQGVGATITTFTGEQVSKSEQQEGNSTDFSKRIGS